MFFHGDIGVVQWRTLLSCVGSREQRCHSFREEKCEPGVECLKSLQGSATVEKLGEEGDRVPLVKVAYVNDVIPGTAKVVQAGQTTCALFNLSGTFYATNNKCTHMGGPLGEGKVEGNVVTCPWHGSRFDIRTGEVVGPPARRPVVRYPVKIQDQSVFVEIP